MLITFMLLHLFHNAAGSNTPTPSSPFMGDSINGVMYAILSIITEK